MPTPISRPSLPAAREASRVLIVDDNAELVDTLRAVIASGVPGLTIEMAANGEAALKMAQKGFDVAIVDVKLPDVSGIDLIQPLRVASPFSEVLLLTGFASVDAVRAVVFADQADRSSIALTYPPVCYKPRTHVEAPIIRTIGLRAGAAAREAKAAYSDAGDRP